MGSRASLAISKDVPADERRFIEGLAVGEDLSKLAKELGWDIEKARRLSRSASLLTAVATQCLVQVHQLHVPRAINVLAALMSGFIEYDEELNGRSIKKVMVKPETRLAAAHAVLRMAGMDKPLEGMNNDKDTDLSSMAPDKLRSVIKAIEDRLADQATPAGQAVAPDSAPGSIEDAEIVNDYSVLD